VIGIKLDTNAFAATDALRGSVRLQFHTPMMAQRVLVKLTATQEVRRPLSHEAPARRVLHEETFELAGRHSCFDERIAFALPLPHEHELTTAGATPRLLKRLVGWIAPDSIQPVRWQIEVRVQRRSDRDLVERKSIELDLTPAAQPA